MTWSRQVDRSLRWQPAIDQRVLPRGSLFVELYNPWVTQNSVTDALSQPSAIESPGEFYTLNLGTNKATGVNLNALAGNSPVRQMLIVKSPAVHPDHDRKPSGCGGRAR